MEHDPVLFQEVMEVLKPVPGGVYVDGTIGAGGHSRGILERSAPDGILIGFDRDPAALALAESNLAEFSDRVTLIHSSYLDLVSHLNKQNKHHIDGILIDLGLSSMQLDSPERGFSFRHEAPLDMRFDPGQSFSASDLVNESTREELTEIIFTYGEEKFSRRIAAAIIANRPLATTKELAELIKRVVPHSRSKIHPATRTFQALRIVVNNELDALEAFLPAALGVLKPGGRLAVIAFHSLEDRIVKGFFRQESRDCICPPELPICVCENKARIKEISRRPIRPEDSEIVENPRARSAKMRAAEKIL
jgi:16S rRNA (cytosine1402-N4)-methyltransferase